MKYIYFIHLEDHFSIALGKDGRPNIAGSVSSQIIKEDAKNEENED